MMPSEQVKTVAYADDSLRSLSLAARKDRAHDIETVFGTKSLPKI